MNGFVRYFRRLGAILAVAGIFALFSGVSTASASVPALVNASASMPAVVGAPDAPPSTGIMVGTACNPGTIAPGGALAATTGTSPEKAKTAAASNLLPVNRWGNVTTRFHTRVGTAALENIPTKVSRDFLFPGMMTIGNLLWSGTAGVTSEAARFCLQDKLAGVVDYTAGRLGTALIFKSPIFVGIIVIGLTVLVYKAGKNQGRFDFKAASRPLVIGGLLIFMVTQAAATVPTNADGKLATSLADTSNQELHFGSPGWFSVTTQRTLSALGSLPMAAISDMGSTSETAGASTPDNLLSCSNFTANMRAKFYQSTGLGATSLAAVVPETISQMWESTGLKIWQQSQFGTQNPWASKVYCRYLESQLGNGAAADSTGMSELDYLKGATSMGSLSVSDDAKNSVAWTSVGTQAKDSNKNPLDGSAPTAVDQVVDQQLVGWAQCNWNGTSWTVDPAWAKLTPGGVNPDSSDPTAGIGIGILGKDNSEWNTQYSFGPLADKDSKESVNNQVPAPGGCDGWWNIAEKNAESSKGGLNMDWRADPSYITNATSGQPGVKDSLDNLHGTDLSAPFGLIYVYVISAFLVFVILGMISFGIIIADLVMLVMAALFVIAMLMSLWPGKGKSAIARYGHFWLSLAVFTVAIQFVFSLVTMITGFLQIGGDAEFGSGSFMGILWTGFSPIIAIIVLNLIFKHGLKMPSILKPSAALAFAGGAAGVGVGLGAGLDRLASKARHPIKSVKSASSRVKSSFSRRGGGGGGGDAGGSGRGDRAGGMGLPASDRQSTTNPGNGLDTGTDDAPENKGPKRSTSAELDQVGTEALNPTQLADHEAHKERVLEREGKEAEAAKALKDAAEAAQASRDATRCDRKRGNAVRDDGAVSAAARARLSSGTGGAWRERLSNWSDNGDKPSKTRKLVGTLGGAGLAVGGRAVQKVGNKVINYANHAVDSSGNRMTAAKDFMSDKPVRRSLSALGRGGARTAKVAGIVAGVAGVGLVAAVGVAIPPLGIGMGILASREAIKRRPGGPVTEKSAKKEDARSAAKALAQQGKVERKAASKDRSNARLDLLGASPPSGAPTDRTPKPKHRHRRGKVVGSKD